MLKSMLQRYDCSSSEKIHQAYREIVQEIVLAGLWQGNFFQEAAFYGGTALRILYGLDRFSEDLDFSLLHPNSSFSMEKFFPTIKKEFDALSIPIELSQKKKTKITNIQSAFLKTDSHVHSLQIIFFAKQIKIKMEVDCNPPLGFHTEEKLLLQPFSFYVKTYTLPNLFAGKLHAILFRKWKERVKGRDFYDLEWYIRRRTPVHTKHFLERAHQSGELVEHQTLSLEQLKILLQQRFRQIDFALAKKDVEPFITSGSAISLWSAEYFTQLIEFLTEDIPQGTPLDFHPR